MVDLLTLLLGVTPLTPFGAGVQGPPAIPADSVCAYPTGFVGPCDTIHGRLSVGNGTPIIRIWKIGTNRILGVPESGERLDRTCALPKQLDTLLVNQRKFVYADFVIRPLTRSRPEYMQMVCVASASHIVMKNAY